MCNAFVFRLKKQDIFLEKDVLTSILFQFYITYSFLCLYTYSALLSRFIFTSIL